MKKLFQCGLLFTMFTLPDISLAEIYQWIDENNQVQFSDTPPVKQDSEVMGEQALALKYSQHKQAALKESLDKIVPSKLVIYTTTNCGYCAKARRYFTENNIAYQEKNIENSSNYKREFKKLGGSGVPVIYWESIKMTGFSVARFEKTYSTLLKAL